MLRCTRAFHPMRGACHAHRSSDDEYSQHTGLIEGEAEGAALLVMNELGLLDEDTHSWMRAYCQHWMQSETERDKLAQRIFRIADTILRAGRMTIAES
jgi:hypothetical protein